MIAVIIPTHNRIPELREALKSVFQQKLLPDHIIVVDDGSVPAVPVDIFTDAPDAIKLTLLRNESPKGGNFARNIGANATACDYIAFLDDDDRWIQNKLQIQVELMREKKLDLCYTGRDIIQLDTNLKVVSEHYSFKSPRFQKLTKSIMWRNFIGTMSSILIKKAHFEIVGGFNTKMPALQDLEFYIRSIFSGARVEGINQPGFGIKKTIFFVYIDRFRTFKISIGGITYGSILQIQIG